MHKPNYIKSFVPKGSFAPIADFELLTTAYGIAKEHGVDPKVGNLLSADNFYTPDTGVNDMWKSMGVLAIEMEAAGLYANAAALGKRALAICTCPTISTARRRSPPSSARPRSAR